MSSRQEQRPAASEAEAEAQRASEQMAHARQAARKITHERTERAHVVGGGGSGGHGHEEAAQPQPLPQRVDIHRGGILETVQQAARSLVSAVSRTLGVASTSTSRDGIAESPFAESKDHAARADKGTEESAADKAKNAGRGHHKVGGQGGEK